MSGLNPFKKPKQDDSAIRAAEARAAEKEAELERQQKEERRKKNLKEKSRRSARGRTSLLKGLETGVDPVQQGKRTSLG